MKKLTLVLLLLLVFCNINQLKAALTANQYKNIIGRGIAAAPDFNDCDQQTMNDFKARGFHNVRLRVKADELYGTSGMNEIAAYIDRILVADLIPIISWVNNSAEETATDAQRSEFVQWWTDVANMVEGRSELIALNLITELSGGNRLRDDLNVFNDWTRRAVNAIRSVSSTRIIMMASRTADSDGLQYIASDIYEGDDYIMAEWHSYAAGPNHKGFSKNWEGDGSAEDRALVTDRIDEALAWTAQTGIPTYLGAWMPMTNKTGDLSQYEAESFARFFLDQLSAARIPWSLNALQQFYDENTHTWIQTEDHGSTTYDKAALLEICLTRGTFIWDQLTEYTLTINTAGSGSGTVTLNPTGGTYLEGTEVTLTASADAGSVFSGWSGDASGTNTQITITMVNDKSVTAAFTLEGSGTEVILGATDDSFVLDNSVNTNKGADNSISIKNVTKKVGLIKFDLASISDPILSATLELNGSNDATGGNVSVYSVTNDNWNESTVTYINAPSKGSLLGSSSLGAAGTVYNIDISSFVIAQNSGDKVVSLWLNDNLSNDVRYDFASKEASGNIGPKLILEVGGTTVTYDLTTSVTGSGTVNPSGGTYDEGTVVTLTATPNTGYEFSHWSGDAGGSTNPVSITMNSDKSITANFTPIPTYNLTTSVTGSGTVSPSGGIYDEGTVVTLTATPNTGYQFSHWSGDAGGSANPINVTMDSDKNIVANFTAVPTYSLTTSVTGSGSVSPASGNFEQGSVVTLTATPSSGYIFSSWSGDISGTANPINVTMNSDKSITANFVPVPTYTLTTNVIGSGSVSPSGGTYTEGTVVTLTATPASGWEFDSWSGDASGTSATTSITMNSNKSVTATFIEEPTGPITSRIHASDDAYVRNGDNRNINYGSDPDLEVKQTSDANKKRYSFIKVDLSTIGTVSNAKLKIESVGNENKDVNVYSISNDNWDENTITWSNMPSLGNVIGTYSIGANGLYTVDVTSFVAAQANGDNVASFALRGTSERLMTFSSKEGTYAPRLVIDHDNVPKSAIDAVTTNVEMYPNPTTGLVNISINDADFSNGIVKVYNENGALLETTTVDNANSTIGLNGEAGLYLIEVNYNGNVETLPVVKE